MQRPWPLLPPQLLRHWPMHMQARFRPRLLNKISGIRLNFVITETFKKLPPPPPPPHTHTKGVLSRCACVTYGRKCARTLCGGRGEGGGNFMTGAAFNMNGGGGGGAAAPPQGYARSATGLDSDAELCYTFTYYCVIRIINFTIL